MDNFKGSRVPGHKTMSALLELGTNRTFLILLGAKIMMVAREGSTESYYLIDAEFQTDQITRVMGWMAVMTMYLRMYILKWLK